MSKTSLISTYSFVMSALSKIYILVGLVFFVYYSKLEAFLGLQESPHRFWLVLVLSMMIMLALIAHWSAKNPMDKNYLILHCTSKITSTVGFLLCMLISKDQFPYLVGMLVDGSIAVMNIMFYRALYEKK